MSRNILREFGNNDFILLFDLPEPSSTTATTKTTTVTNTGLATASAANQATNNLSNSNNNHQNTNNSSYSSAFNGLYVNQENGVNSNEQGFASTPQSALGSLASLGSSAYRRPYVLHLVAPNFHDKAAWMSDMSQVSLIEIYLDKQLFYSYFYHHYHHHHHYCDLFPLLQFIIIIMDLCSDCASVYL